MKRLMVTFMILFCAANSLAQFPTNTSTATLDMKTHGPDFTDFLFRWDAWSDQRCTFSIENDSSVVNITNYLAQFRVTGRTGTSVNSNFISVATGDITMQYTNQITFAVDRDDLPLPDAYNAQLVLLSSSSTQTVAVLGKGTVLVTPSLWRTE